MDIPKDDTVKVGDFGRGVREDFKIHQTRQLWCHEVRYGVVKFGVVRCGVVSCGIARCGANRYTRLENLAWSHSVSIQFSFCRKRRFMKPLLLSSVDTFCSLT